MAPVLRPKKKSNTPKKVKPVGSTSKKNASVQTDIKRKPRQRIGRCLRPHEICHYNFLPTEPRVGEFLFLVDTARWQDEGLAELSPCQVVAINGKYFDVSNGISVRERCELKDGFVRLPLVLGIQKFKIDLLECGMTPLAMYIISPESFMKDKRT